MASANIASRMHNPGSDLGSIGDGIRGNVRPSYQVIVRSRATTDEAAHIVSDAHCLIIYALHSARITAS